jgi:hypothetical protein
MKGGLESDEVRVGGYYVSALDHESRERLTGHLKRVLP